jgi:putative flippase GtrA
VNVKALTEHSFVRFLFGGGVTVVCEYVIFYVLYVFLHWNLLLANSLSFGVGLCVSFVFNRLWAFNKPSYQRKAHHQVLLYVILGVTNLLLNNLIVSGLKGVGFDPRFGKIVAIVFIAASNFVIYRKIIFVDK